MGNAVPPIYSLCLKVTFHLYLEEVSLSLCPSRAQVYLVMDNCIWRGGRWLAIEVFTTQATLGKLPIQNL